MTVREFLELHKQCTEQMHEITKKKNSDYTGATSDPFANFKQIGALMGDDRQVMIGILTRMSDKMSRLASFLKKGSFQVKDESFEDTCLDLANYSIILRAVFIDEQRRKDGEPKDSKTLEGYGTDVKKVI